MISLFSIPACESAEPQAETENEPEQTAPSPVAAAIPQSDFTARGSEPYWRLDLDFEQGMYLSGLSVENEIKASLPEREALEGGGFRYSAETELGTLTVEVLPGKCTDSMSGEEFPFTVKCLAGEKEYLGCGNFNADSNLIGGDWILASFNDENVLEKKMTLSLDTKMAGVSGTDGCNRFFGKAEITNDRLLLGPLGSTLMACEDMSSAQGYTQFLNSGELQVQMINGLMILSNGTEKLEFKRK